MDLLTSVFIEVFNKMPTSFTSQKFNKAVRKRGFEPNKLGLRFLILNARQMDSGKTWVKLEKGGTIPLPAPNGRIESAISLLKSNGYKVMKPVNEWVEL